MTDYIVDPAPWGAHQLNGDWVKFPGLVEPGKGLEVPHGLGELLLDPLLAE